jgi:acyl-CoA synthetase (AMP-forming)/AMP-acid ligase II
MMVNYYNRAAATAEASWYDDEGRRFHRSGDVGWQDEEGFIYLLDRKKDMIISGGFNVYAIDLEKVLLEHPSVADAAVIAAPSEQWGETPFAFIVLRAGATIDPTELMDWANAKLGKAQRISNIRMMDELPRSPIGKVLKRELRELLQPQFSRSEVC